MTKILNSDNWNMNIVGLDTIEYYKWRILVSRLNIDTLLIHRKKIILEIAKN